MSSQELLLTAVLAVGRSASPSKASADTDPQGRSKSRGFATASRARSPFVRAPYLWPELGSQVVEVGNLGCRWMSSIWRAYEARSRHPPAKVSHSVQWPSCMSLTTARSARLSISAVRFGSTKSNSPALSVSRISFAAPMRGDIMGMRYERSVVRISIGVKDQITTGRLLAVVARKGLEPVIATKFRRI